MRSSMEARPLSVFHHIDADFIYRNAFLLNNNKTPSFRAIRALIASQSTFKK